MLLQMSNYSPSFYSKSTQLFVGAVLSQDGAIAFWSLPTQLPNLSSITITKIKSQGMLPELINGVGVRGGGSYII